ncbi:hypothetical protein [Methanosarcina mazei]|jgi:hypothetical protein|uniref:Uncharacterized protein n=6 Tax=Methanosarcina mazei TaxID=2209 RepID=A0A0F8BMD9_METMZ|nr:hypothetical protein [Methanosarcina mazei]AAM32433.1 conserved protein [Methanosarcina mazei Go1]AKB61854.1 hypothetical protein MSMAP_1869 [Methanosarcina mazei SarPi]AKB65170.1 hypothetical protein MSMAS_1974 [Methanosarcina mazei S-6]AKB68540.1 hypothetical protein MSMAL_1997 [Methanosarcina mazei LYC]AKB71036.1 hypothetical protein MSMAC_1146 [Methanosarcina mazei C16]
MEKEESAKWTKVEEILQKAEKKELIGLIQELYKHSVGDRMLINSRYLGEGAKQEMNTMLEKYRKIIKEEFLTEKKLAKIHYSVAERAISDYSNASGDFVGTLDLMLTYVEEGVQFARIFGVIGDEFYDSIEGMLDRLCEQLKTKEGQKYYPLFRERLLKAGTGLENIGWGFEDAICILVADIEEFFEERFEEDKNDT